MKKGNIKLTVLVIGLIMLVGFGGCVTTCVGYQVYRSSNSPVPFARTIGKDKSRLISLFGQPDAARYNVRIWKAPRELTGATNLVAYLSPTDKVQSIVVYFRDKSARELLPFANEITRQDPNFYGVAISSKGAISNKRIAVWRKKNWDAVLTDSDPIQPLADGSHPYDGGDGTSFLLTRDAEGIAFIKEIQALFSEVTLPFLGDAFELGDVEYTLEKVEARAGFSQKALDDAFDLEDLKIGETRTVRANTADKLVIKYRIENKQSVAINITPDIRLTDLSSNDSHRIRSKPVRLKAGESKLIEVEILKMKRMLEGRWKVVFHRNGNERDIELVFHDLYKQ